MSEDEQAIQCAVEQAARDMPYAEITDAAIYRKIVNEDRKLARSDEQALSTTSDRWYVEVTLRHPMEETTAMALYRVWLSSGEGLRAIRVTIV